MTWTINEGDDWEINWSIEWYPSNRFPILASVNQWPIDNQQTLCPLPSLRSKRFRGVWEQRKTEERDFRCFSHGKNGVGATKRKRGMGEGNEGTACRQTPEFWKPQWLAGLVKFYWHVSIKELNFWGVQGCLQSFNFSSPNEGWLKKQLFTEGDLLAVRLLSDSVLQGFRDLHRCGKVRQKFCSAKPTLWDFEPAHYFRSKFLREDLYSDT